MLGLVTCNNSGSLTRSWRIPAGHVDRRRLLLPVLPCRCNLWPAAGAVLNYNGTQPFPCTVRPLGRWWRQSSPPPAPPTAAGIPMRRSPTQAPCPPAAPSPRPLPHSRRCLPRCPPPPPAGPPPSCTWCTRGTAAWPTWWRCWRRTRRACRWVGAGRSKYLCRASGSHVNAGESGGLVAAAAGSATVGRVGWGQGGGETTRLAWDIGNDSGLALNTRERMCALAHMPPATAGNS